MSGNSRYGPEIAVVADADGVHISVMSVDNARVPGTGSVTIPLGEALRFLQKFEAALRAVAPQHAEATSYLDFEDAATTFPDFSDDEVLTSLYAEPVEDEEELERRTLVMRRVSAAIHACSGISTVDLKRMVSLSRRQSSGETGL